jgi:hypothetical protein
MSDADTAYWKSVAQDERKKNAELLKRNKELWEANERCDKMLIERDATIARLVKEIEGKNG